jgi:predicted transcriptional regulator
MPRTKRAKSEQKDAAVFAQVDRMMKRQLEDLAREQDVPEAHIIREALRQYLRKMEKEAKAA